jgi:curved DNA-binding protein CbpA/murein DD-endopeptidase MepM/ murein hydrolase activator NlpD
MLCVVVSSGAWAINGGNVPSTAGASQACPGNYFKLTPKGGNEFTLTYYENGKAKETFDIVSGYKGKVPTEASADAAGSNNPIPQGVFSIGTPVAQSTINPSAIPEIGETWIPIDTKGYGGRSAIGFHTDGDGNDANIDGQSRGCVTLKNKATYDADIKKIAAYVNAGARTLIVDHGLKENSVAGVCSPDGAATAMAASPPAKEVKSIASIRNDLAKSCFGGPVIAFSFAVPFIFGEELHKTFAPYVAGLIAIVFAIWAYLKVGSALLPFGPKDKAAALFNELGIRFFVVLGVSVFLLAPQTGYAAYRDYIITPILSAGSTIVDEMYQIGIKTNPTLKRFADEDGKCTPTTIKGLDPKLTQLKDDLECKVCMIQRAYSYPWSYGLFQTGNGKIFTGIPMMLVGIAPFVMFLFTVADVFMVRIGYVSCTLSAYVAAGCFPASRKYAITGLKSLSDGAFVLVTSMIAAMLSISMLTTVIENLDKGGAKYTTTTANARNLYGNTSGNPNPRGLYGTSGNPNPRGLYGNTSGNPNPRGLYGNTSGNANPNLDGKGTSGKTIKTNDNSTPPPPKTSASTFETPSTTYATGAMGASTGNPTYAAWYRNTYLRPGQENAGGFDSFREKMLSDIGLGGVKLNSPFIGSPPPESRTVSFDQSFGWCRAHWRNRPSPHHNGLDFGCGGGGQPMTPIAPCEVIYAGYAGGLGNKLDCRVLLPDGTKSNVVFRYAHMMHGAPKFAPGTQLNPGQVVGKCGNTGFSKGAHLHLEIYMDSANVPILYPGNANNVLCGNSAGHRPGAPAQFGRNAYYLNPAPLLAGAVSLAGVEGAGFSAQANSFKNFGILNSGFLLVLIICIVSLQVLKQSQKFLSSQGMGILMKAFGQILSGAMQALSSLVTVGMKVGEAAAPAVGWVGEKAGGAIMSIPGVNQAVNRAAEGVQGAMNNVTQGLTGVMDNIGSTVGGVVSGVQQSVQNAMQPITDRVMELQQGLRELANGVMSNDAVQSLGRFLPGLTAAALVASKVGGFVGRSAFENVVAPTLVEATKQTFLAGAATLLDPYGDLGLEEFQRDFVQQYQNTREALAKAPVDAPREEPPVVQTESPTTPQTEGLVRVVDTGSTMNRSGPSDTERTGSSAGERQQAESYYDLLGVAAGASRAEIKAAYRDLAKQYHPDNYRTEDNRDGASEDVKNKMRDINIAYEILGDDKLRAKYDSEMGITRDGPPAPAEQREQSQSQKQEPESRETLSLSGTAFAAVPEREASALTPRGETNAPANIAIARTPQESSTAAPTPRGEMGGSAPDNIAIARTPQESSTAAPTPRGEMGGSAPDNIAIARPPQESSTAAPIPRGETGGYAASPQNTSRQNSVEKAREAFESGGYASGGNDDDAGDDMGDDEPEYTGDDTPSKTNSREKEQQRKEEEEEKRAKAKEEKKRKEEEEKKEEEKKKAKKRKEEKEEKDQAELTQRIKDLKEKENRAVLNRRIEELIKQEEENLTPTGPKTRR